MNTTGAYSSPYNYIYHYMLDNFEPDQEIPEDLLQKEYKAFCLIRNLMYTDQQAQEDIKKAISNFKKNNGEHGGDGHNFGKVHTSPLDTIKDSLKDLRW